MNVLHSHTEHLQELLEEQFEMYTGQLTELIVRGASRDGLEADPVDALSTSSRQALTDIAHALRRMAEGTYGACERCGGEIPVERLEITPHARYCSSCQSIPPDVLCRPPREASHAQ